MDTSKIIGDKSKFAINYRSESEIITYSPNNQMAICHLIIGNNFIGRPDEGCYLPTWLFSLINLRNRIVDTYHLLYPKEFDGLTDREIFETILKANQIEKEFHPDFKYLPQLDEKIWYNHSFTIDETIDAYIIYFYVKDNQITFLIEDDIEGNESEYRSYKFIFQKVDFDQFISTIDETKDFLIQQYPYLRNNVTSRTHNSS
jgi:hypothetical protein